MKKIAKNLTVAFLFIAVFSGISFSSVLYQDQFNDGDFETAEGSDGLSWTIIEGNAEVKDRNGSNMLGVYRGTSTIVTEQTISSPEYTLRCDVSNTWSENGRLIVLYIDQDNFYSVGIGGDPGIFRRMNGSETRLYEDKGSIIRLPHAAPSNGSFKIYVKNDGSSITIKADRAGDGVDYDAEIRDADPQAVSRFVDTKIGMMTHKGSAVYSPWFFIDNVEIHDVLVEDPRVPAVYYVDSATGDDTRTLQEAQSSDTPWKTIQKAADTMFSGDTVKVMPGIYRETVTPKYSGAENLPITYQAYNPNNRPILDGAGTLELSSWEAVSITDFKGNTHQVYKTLIDWEPNAVFQNNVRMFLSQEPNQSNPNDPYNHDELMEVPDAYNDGTSHTDLIDPVFLIQPDPGYWTGGILMLYQRYGNYIAESNIVDYVPSENKIVVEAFNQWVFIGPDHGGTDRYAITSHIGVLDKPGEYYVDTSTTPYEMYVWPYTGEDVSTVTAARYAHAFDLDPAYKHHIIIDGFEIRYYQGNGIQMSRDANDIIIRNCEIHHNMGSGTYARFCDNILIENTKTHHNHWNGFSFSNGRNYSVINCEITANSDNGIWVGSGTTDVFATYNVTIRGNYFHDQGGGRRHPDNYQMHQCQNVILENNIFEQYGHQNMWTAYSGDFIIRNNIFIGGVVGINGTINSWLYNNVFYKSSIRYDAHLTNNPHRGDYYKPQSVTIQNNMIIESAISMPDKDVVDWSTAFTVDHNYYNIENRWLRSSWKKEGEEYGRGVGYGEGSIVFEDHGKLLESIVRKPDENYKSYDFHLVEGSPCIDAGREVPVEYDREGNERPDGYGYDIGPYEYYTGITYIDPMAARDHTSLVVYNNIIKTGGNTTAIISCFLKEPGELKVKVYNTSGKEIITLADGNYPAGEQQILWTGVDTDNNKIGSGIYIVHMKAGGYKETKKIAVVK